jgi:hypothetical protein
LTVDGRVAKLNNGRVLDIDSILRPTMKRGFDLRVNFRNAQCTGFNGCVLREEEVKREEVKRAARGFFPLSHSLTLSLSQLKIQNSLTVNCSIVQSHGYRLKNLALHNSGMILIVLWDGPMSPKACIFTAGGTPNPYSPQ